MAAAEILRLVGNGVMNVIEPDFGTRASDHMVRYGTDANSRVSIRRGAIS